MAVHKRRGFTLIELLVVIAIIALLMSILMPALSKAKQQAKAAVCLSNLHQWAIVLSMYTGENNGYFLAGNEGITGGWAWMEVLRPYYSDDKLHLCPMARRVRYNTDYEAGGTFYAWNPGTVAEPLYGSYGLNGWLANPAPGESEVFGRPVGDNWRTVSVKPAATIPMVADCGIWDGWPLKVDKPPPYPDMMTEHGVLNSEMRRFCLNRHMEHVNGAFADFSCRRMGLKELWRLRWHRGYKVNDPQPAEWNEPKHWMYAMKDY
ncbi:MAG TPA: type II secretion system protein [Sedimentisphaerales bacterium]|nr:type II secretion system protein [Sedimentisphaerales bacterium]